MTASMWAVPSASSSPSPSGAGGCRRTGPARPPRSGARSTTRCRTPRPRPIAPSAPFFRRAFRTTRACSGPLGSAPRPARSPTRFRRRPARRAGSRGSGWWIAPSEPLPAWPRTRCFAASDGGNTGISIGGYGRDRRPFVYVDFASGTWGGRPFADGLEGNASMFANMASHSVETTEAEQPIQILRYDLVPDRMGAGRFPRRRTLSARVQVPGA